MLSDSYICLSVFCKFSISIMANHQTTYRSQRGHNYYDMCEIENEPNSIDRILQLANHYYCSFTQGEYSNSVGLIAFCICAGFAVIAFSNMILNICLVGYPLYRSVKAIESRATGDDTAWLMYWVVYSSFSCLEFFSDIILSWLPFYYFLKCMFLGWCMGIFPFAGNGSTLIYGKFIRPFVLRNEGKIDEALGMISDKAGKLAGEATGCTISNLAETVMKCSDKCRDVKDTFMDIQDTCKDTINHCKDTFGYKDTYDTCRDRCRDEYESCEPDNEYDSCGRENEYKTFKRENRNEFRENRDNFSEIRGTCMKSKDKCRELFLSSSDSDMESCVQEQQQSAISESITSNLTSLIDRNTTGGNFNRDSKMPDPREFIKKLLESAYNEERKRNSGNSNKENRHTHF